MSIRNNYKWLRKNELKTGTVTEDNRYYSKCVRTLGIALVIILCIFGIAITRSSVRELIEPRRGPMTSSNVYVTSLREVMTYSRSLQSPRRGLRVSSDLMTSSGEGYIRRADSERGQIGLEPPLANSKCQSPALTFATSIFLLLLLLSLSLSLSYPSLLFLFLFFFLQLLCYLPFTYVIVLHNGYITS